MLNTLAAPCTYTLDSFTGKEHCSSVSRWYRHLNTAYWKPLRHFTPNETEGEEKDQKKKKESLTSYGGFRHHGRNVLGPVEGHRASHLRVRRVAPRGEGHDRGVVDDLLRLHLVGHVALEAQKTQAVEPQGPKNWRWSLLSLQHPFSGPF